MSPPIAEAKIREEGGYSKTAMTFSDAMRRCLEWHQMKRRENCKINGHAKKSIEIFGDKPLIWHPEGKNGYSKHWYSKQLTKEQREAVKRFCDAHGLEWEEDEMNLDSDYMLNPGNY